MASHRQTTRKRPLDTLSARVRRAWVIDPRTVQWISYWDLVTTAALVFTALVTPVEVAFLEPTAVEARLSNALYLTNRAVDIVFITDMLLQFRVAIKLRDVKLGTYWVVNPATIARHYLLSKWFFLDFFSILTSLFDIVEFPGAKSLTALRSVRVLRLFKLIRLLRGSRIFKHWEMRMSINYAYLSLTQTIVMLVVGCHWFACIWGLQASFNPLGSWPGGTNYCVPYRADDDFAACPEGWRCNAAGGYSCVGAFKLYLYYRRLPSSKT